MADDYLTQALQASMARNPYAQLGAGISQAKNPYLGKDPWNDLAAIGAQGFIGGLAGGYGQAQVQNDMNRIAPIMGQLYQNPTQVTNPGIDDALFNDLVLGATKSNLEQQKKWADIYQTEAIKAQIQGADPLNQIRTRKEGLDLVRELEWAQKNGMLAQSPGATNQEADIEGAKQAAPMAVPSPQDVFGAVAMPAQAQAPAMAANAAQEMSQQQALLPVPSLEEAMSKYPSLSYKDAEKEALGDIREVKKANLKLQTEALKPKAPKAEAKGGQDDLAAWLEETSKVYNQIDMPVQAIGAALPKLPDFGAPLGIGKAKEVGYELGARALKGTPQGDSINEALKARGVINSNIPKFIGEIRKFVLPGSLTEKELVFLFSTVPTEAKTEAENLAIYETMVKARDLLKFENSFKQYMAKRGFNKSQIIGKWEDTRRQLGGSFLVNGELNPKIPGYIDALNRGDL